MATPALNPLVEKVRAAHPGAYDDMDDAALTKAVLAKYPQYSDLAAPPISQAPGGKGIAGTAKYHQTSPQAAATMHPGPEGLEADPNNPHPYVGMPGAWPMNRPVTGKDLIPGAIAGGAAATIMGGPIVRAAAIPIARLAAKHPFISMGAIEAAKQLPGTAGKIAGHIPSWLPLLAEGKGAAAETPELDATGENRPFAGGIDEPKPGKILDATGENKPFAGGMDEYVPKKAPSKIVTPIESQSSAASAYDVGPRPVIQKGPIAGSPEDLAETRGIQERIRDAANQEEHTFNSQNKREWFARNAPGQTKGELIQATKKSPSDLAFEKNFPNDKFETKMSPSEVRAWQESIGNPLPKEEDIGAKVRAKNPEPTRAEVKAGRATAAASRQAPPTPASDLTPEWTKALEDLKAKKGRR